MTTTAVHHLGSPTHVGGLSVFPVWTDAPVPRRAVRTAAPRGVAVDEVPDGPDVARLFLANPTATTFLLPLGTLFDAGWQHRVLVHDVLVPAGAALDIDVRCVEAGRWHGTGRQRVHRRRAPLAVRGALRGVRHQQVRHERAARADQGDVWQRVHRYEQAIGASASSSLVEISGRLEHAVHAVLARVRPLPGQRGVLVGIGGHPVLLETFDHPRTLAAQWDAVLAGLVADATLVEPRPTPGRRARAFAARASGRPLHPVARAGAGVAIEAGDDLIAADGLATTDDRPDGPPDELGRVVHLSVLNVRHELVGAA